MTKRLASSVLSDNVVLKRQKTTLHDYVKKLFDTESKYYLDPEIVYIPHASPTMTVEDAIVFNAVMTPAYIGNIIPTTRDAGWIVKKYNRQQTDNARYNWVHLMYNKLDLADDIRIYTVHKYKRIYLNVKYVEMHLQEYYSILSLNEHKAMFETPDISDWDAFTRIIYTRVNISETTILNDIDAFIIHINTDTVPYIPLNSDQSICRSVNQSVDQSVNQSVDQRNSDLIENSSQENTAQENTETTVHDELCQTYPSVYVSQVMKQYRICQLEAKIYDTVREINNVFHVTQIFEIEKNYIISIIYSFMEIYRYGKTAKEFNRIRHVITGDSRPYRAHHMNGHFYDILFGCYRCSIQIENIARVLFPLNMLIEASHRFNFQYFTQYLNKYYLLVFVRMVSQSSNLIKYALKLLHNPRCYDEIEQYYNGGNITYLQSIAHKHIYENSKAIHDRIWPTHHVDIPVIPSKLKLDFHRRRHHHHRTFCSYTSALIKAEELPVIHSIISTDEDMADEEEINKWLLSK